MTCNGKTLRMMLPLPLPLQPNVRILIESISVRVFVPNLKSPVPPLLACMMNTHSKVADKQR